MALFSLVLSSSSGMGQALYSITPIHAPQGSGAISVAGVSINEMGEVVGEYSRLDQDLGNNQIRSFYHSDITGTVDFWPEEYKSVAEGINNSGQIALYGGDRSAPPEAYRFTPGIGYESLGNFGGRDSESQAINNLGQVTGFSENSEGHSVAFRYTDGVGLEAIGSSFIASTGYDINDLGWVSGWGDGNAFLYRDDLGLLDLGPGWGYGINDAGSVVGQALLPTGQAEAFIYMDGTYRLLTQSGFQNTALGDINNQGVAVGIGGVSMGLSAPKRALLWTEDTGFVDLTTLLPEDSGWTLISALAINEAGQITGVGSFDGSPIGFRLDPIPEPSTWGLLVLGGLFGWFQWRRIRSRH